MATCCVYGAAPFGKQTAGDKVTKSSLLLRAHLLEGDGSASSERASAVEERKQVMDQAWEYYTAMKKPLPWALAWKIPRCDME